MKINEERPQGESKVSFNIADAIVIIIALAIITAFILRIYNIVGVDTNTQNVRVQFRVSGVSVDAPLPENNDILYASASGNECGYIEGYSINETKMLAYTESGEKVYVTLPNKIDLIGSVVLHCIKTNGCFYTDDTVLLTVGNTVTLHTNERELVFEILAIEEIPSN